MVLAMKFCSIRITADKNRYSAVEYIDYETLKSHFKDGLFEEVQYAFIETRFRNLCLSPKSKERLQGTIWTIDEPCFISVYEEHLMPLTFELMEKMMESDKNPNANFKNAIPIFSLYAQRDNVDPSWKDCLMLTFLKSGFVKLLVISEICLPEIHKITNLPSMIMNSQKRIADKILGKHSAYAKIVSTLISKPLNAFETQNIADKIDPTIKTICG